MEEREEVFKGKEFNMARVAEEPKQIFPDMVSDCKEVFGNDLVSIILYGSAAEGYYKPGKSDINFLIVLTEAGIDNLDRAFGKIGKWKKKKIATPLFLTEEYIRGSVDVYPIEYLNFQRHNEIVYGKNVLEDLVVDRKMLRLQCEREIKGKLLLLRRVFLETEGKSRALKEVIAISLPTFMAIFEALRFLRGHEERADRRQKIKEICEDFGLDKDLFDTLLSLKEDKLRLKDDELKELFKGYLKQVRDLAIKVDRMEV